MTAKAKELQAIVQGTVEAHKEVVELSGPQGDIVKVRAEMDQIMVDVSRLEVRSNHFTHVEGRIAAIDERAKEMEEDQKATQRSFLSVSKDLKGMQGAVGELGDKVESVALARRELEEFSGPEGALAKIQGQVDEAREKSLDYAQEVARIREDQADARAAQEAVLARYEDIRTKLEGVDRGVDKASAGMTRIDSVMKDFTKAEELGARAERQLKALQALSDHINQKLASVERQREALDRTEAQARSLTDLHWELDAKLKEARSQINEVKKVHSSVEKLREMNTRVAERSAEMRVEQSSVERESKTLRAALGGVQEQMKVTTRRFELEKSTLEADGQRVLVLRSDVTDLETRFRQLEEAGRLVNDTSRKVEEMSGRTVSLSGDLSRLAEQVELVEGMREGMMEARRSAVEVAGSLARLEARQSGVRDAVEGIRLIRGAQEEVAGALERLRSTRAEIDRVHAAQADTGSWLARTHQSVQELRTNVSQLDDLAANVDHMRQVGDQVIAAAADLDERRESFAELEARMSELRQVGTALDERTNNLLGGLADADSRFKVVARNAEKADAVRVAMEGVIGDVEQAEARMAELGEGVESSVERAQKLAALSDRADRVMADIEQREQALAKAAAQLDGVSTLRKEAAEVVQSLEDKIRGLNEGLIIAGEQSDKIGERADVLEARAGSLRFAEKRITQFEEKLARLDSVEEELRLALDTLLARQEGVGQIRSDVERVFTVSEKTLGDVQAISAARGEVQKATDLLETVRGKADAMTEALDSIDIRHQQIEKAEVRLGRADALLREIRAGLESLSSQRAVVDRVISTSGQLDFESREAEGLIRALREERDLMQGIHDAVKELREEDSDEVHLDFGKKKA